MINEDRAYSIATTLLGRPADDPDQPWHLIEFVQGWLIDETGHKGDDFIGTLGRVIERASGRVLGFPSWVPTDRILADYGAVVGDAYVESQ